MNPEPAVTFLSLLPGGADRRVVEGDSPRWLAPAPQSWGGPRGGPYLASLLEVPDASCSTVWTGDVSPTVSPAGGETPSMWCRQPRPRGTEADLD